MRQPVERVLGKVNHVVIVSSRVVKSGLHAGPPVSCIINNYAGGIPVIVIAHRKRHVWNVIGLEVPCIHGILRGYILRR